MSWDKKAGSRRRYLYIGVKRQGIVTKHYFGRGEMAEIAARQLELRKARRAAIREQKQRALAELRELTALLARLKVLRRALMNTTLEDKNP